MTSTNGRYIIECRFILENNDVMRFAHYCDIYDDSLLTNMKKYEKVIDTIERLGLARSSSECDGSLFKENIVRNDTISIYPDSDDKEILLLLHKAICTRFHKPYLHTKRIDVILGIVDSSNTLLYVVKGKTFSNIDNVGIENRILFNSKPSILKRIINFSLSDYLPKFLTKSIDNKVIKTAAIVVPIMLFLGIPLDHLQPVFPNTSADAVKAEHITIWILIILNVIFTNCFAREMLKDNDAKRNTAMTYYGSIKLFVIMVMLEYLINIFQVKFITGENLQGMALFLIILLLSLPRCLVYIRKR